MATQRSIRQCRDAANALINTDREDAIVTPAEAARTRAEQVLALSSCIEWLEHHAGADDSVRDDLPGARACLTALAEQLTAILQRKS